MYHSAWMIGLHLFNTLRPRQNERHFPDAIFKCISLNENVQISLTISLKFVPKVRISNIPSLVQIMAWRRPGDKSLSEPMMVYLLTHICVTRPQWVNDNTYDILAILWLVKNCSSCQNSIGDFIAIWLNEIKFQSIMEYRAMKLRFTVWKLEWN